jgi:hypothetical protein
MVALHLVSARGAQFLRIVFGAKVLESLENQRVTRPEVAADRETGRTSSHH